ncbi:MAG: trimethylamine methyltransferase family protein [Rhodobacter sp.]|nr:trimethylamine methyltransferase family protein [Paracoccaceae bacterium]MCC0078205.1 trimethylamine methyltransferase family protein [Rhodobacter sp.]
MDPDPKPRRRRGAHTPPARVVNYRQLRHPFAPQAVFSEDEVAAIHHTALRVLQELGIKVLLPEARQILARAGARLDGEMVFLGSDLVAEALTTAPRSIRLRAANPLREQVYEDGALLFTPGSGCPNVTDMDRGRRPGSLDSYVETLKLHQSFDVIHALGPSAEPQDIPPHLRHYAMMQAQMQVSDKPMFVYARGRAQIEQSLEMIRIGLALSEDDFATGVWAITVINSNSPRVLDTPMAQGVIDFARAGQMSIITPFCLAGAMAPVTVAGALALQHAEALACITLAQMTRAGAPVSYGGFSSNVDMKSGAPAFGTPEHIKMQIGSGQLARLIGLPWRSAAGSASNLADVQGATESLMGLWGNLMANATMVVHAAGWLEGGLSFGYEKFITDVEALQTLAELCTRPSGTAEDIGFDAIAEVAPGGHFFAAQHTMARYSTAFYPPLIADLSNFGTWQAGGAKTATERARAVWRQTLDTFTPPAGGDAAADRLRAYIDRASAAGGAPPLE